MTGKERAYLVLGVWLAIYPVSTGLTYLMQPFDVPIYLKTFVSTLLTVPLISLVVVPVLKKLMAKAEHKPELAEN